MPFWSPQPSSWPTASPEHPLRLTLGTLLLFSTRTHTLGPSRAHPVLDLLSGSRDQRNAATSFCCHSQAQEREQASGWGEKEEGDGESEGCLGFRPPSRQRQSECTVAHGTPAGEPERCAPFTGFRSPSSGRVVFARDPCSQGVPQEGQRVPPLPSRPARSRGP